MLKQFHVENKMFADPIVMTDEQGNPILTTAPHLNVGELQYITSGDGWYLIETQEEINGISASITGDGEVWVEANKIHFSGRRPSEQHIWDKQTKSWVQLTAEQQQVQIDAKFAQQKAEIIAQLTAKTDQLKAQILAGYSQAEIESFYKQEDEARAWKADNQALTPMLSKMVEKRPEIPSLEVLVEKVIEKADAFSAVMGTIIGKKQAIETRIELAKNSDELTACEQEIEQWQLVSH